MFDLSRYFNLLGDVTRCLEQGHVAGQKWGKLVETYHPGFPLKPFESAASAERAARPWLREVVTACRGSWRRE